MALDNRLVVYNEQGEPVDYDILASDVKFLPDGKDLPTKLAELEDEIGQGGYEPPAGGIPKTDLAQSVQDSLDKADSALQDEDVAEVAKTGDYNDLENKPTIPDTSDLATKTELQQGLGEKQDALVAGNGIVIGNDGKTVSVDAEVVQPVQVDGTFAIRIGTDTYTINLNHTHPNMAKLIVCEESDLPSTLDPATIYAITDSGETEIEKLIIRGMEFVGGGIPDTGEPMISSPSNGSTINLGDNTDGQGVSKTITVKGKNLTGDLTVAVGTGLTISYGQSTGQSSVTIPMAQALLGAQVTIAYSGSGALNDGSLVISHGGSVLSSVVVVVETQPIAVKFTGSQWVNTGIGIGPNTSMKLDIEFLNAFGNKTSGGTFLSTSNSGFAFNTSIDSSNPSTNDEDSILFWVQGQSVSHDFGNALYSRGVINYSLGNLSFLGWTTTVATKTTTSENLAIGYGYNKNVPIFDRQNLKVYGLEIYESGALTHHFVPKNVNGVTGLYDTETGNFISSETSTELEAVYEQNNS